MEKSLLVVMQYEALIFLESDRKQEYGYDGEFTNAMNRTNKDLRRFSDIPSDELHVVPMKGSMLYDTERVARWVKEYDPTRLVNPASGGNDFPVGDIKDAFDPKGILNPGKIFADDDPCTQAHVEEGFRVSH